MADVNVTTEPIIGGPAPVATLDQVAAYFLGNDARQVDDTGVAEIVNALWEYGGRVGIRPDLAAAQIAHETNVLAFGGDVNPAQHNPAGIGTTGGGVKGVTFADWRTGIAAYFVHLLTWCGQDDLARVLTTAPASLDPRVPLVRQARATKGPATTWASLGGRWAVPGETYAAGIERHYSAILALPAPPGAQKGPSMTVPIREAIIPAANTKSNRPMTKLQGGKPTFITIHETANTAAGANAEMHRRFTHGANGWGGGGHPATATEPEYEGVSFHYVVDDAEAVHLLPDDEIGYHAGDGLGKNSGGATSLGIETCVNSDGNFPKTLANLAQLVALLMQRHAIPLANVVQHNHWSGKDCPHNLRVVGWDRLLVAIAANYKALTTTPAPLSGESVSFGIDAQGRATVFVNFGGQAVNILGVNFADLGVTVQNAQGEVFDRSLQAGAFGPWVKRA